MITFVVLPILIPFVLIIVLLIFNSDKLACWLGPAASLLLLVLSIIIFILVQQHGVLALQMGNWEAPFGITLVVDYLSALMLIISAIILFAIAVYALNYLPKTIRINRFFVFFFGLVMGMNGAFVTGDVFNLFVWFEVMLMSSFNHGTFERTTRGGYKIPGSEPGWFAPFSGRGWFALRKNRYP